MRRIVIFGVRSPMVPDFEDACKRAGIDIAAAVQCTEDRARLLDRRPLVTLAETDPAHLSVPCIACAFSPLRRQSLVAAAIEAGFKIAEPLIDTTAVVAGSVRIGSGSFVGANSTIGPASLIGDNGFVNRASNLGHHTVLDDFATVGPGVTIAGNVTIGEAAVIGAGSTVLPGLKIGAGAMVAAGSVVRQDVADGVLVAGSPAVPRSLKPEETAVHMNGEE